MLVDRNAISTDPHFAESETPHYLGRAAAALAQDPNKMSYTGTGSEPARRSSLV